MGYPRYPASEWQNRVVQSNTRYGYQQWVAAMPDSVEAPAGPICAAPGC
jgi:hypothetical protein